MGIARAASSSGCFASQVHEQLSTLELAGCRGLRDSLRPEKQITKTDNITTLMHHGFMHSYERFVRAGEVQDTHLWTLGPAPGALRRFSGTCLHSGSMPCIDTSGPILVWWWMSRSPVAVPACRLKSYLRPAKPPTALGFALAPPMNHSTHELKVRLGGRLGAKISGLAGAVMPERIRFGKRCS